DQEPAAPLDLERLELPAAADVLAASLEDRLAVPDDLDRLERVVPQGVDLERDAERRSRSGAEDFARQAAGRLDQEDRAVGDEGPARAQALPEAVPGERPVEVDVHAVVADGVGEDARGGAGGGREPEAAVEEPVVDLLRVEAVPARAGELLAPSRPAP